MIPRQDAPNQLYLPLLDPFSTAEISENSLLGSLCGGIVVNKDETRKELILHITTLYDGAKTFNISNKKYVGFVKDFELVNFSNACRRQIHPYSLISMASNKFNWVLLLTDAFAESKRGRLNLDKEKKPSK